MAGHTCMVGVRYHLLKGLGLVPNIAEPSSDPHSPLSHHCSAPLYNETDVQFTLIEIYCETCVWFKGTSGSGQSFPSLPSCLAIYHSPYLRLGTT